MQRWAVFDLENMQTLSRDGCNACSPAYTNANGTKGDDSGVEGLQVLVAPGYSNL